MRKEVPTSVQPHTAPTVVLLETQPTTSAQMPALNSLSDSPLSWGVPISVAPAEAASSELRPVTAGPWPISCMKARRDRDRHKGKYEAEWLVSAENLHAIKRAMQKQVWWTLSQEQSRLDALPGLDTVADWPGNPGSRQPRHATEETEPARQRAQLQPDKHGCSSGPSAWQAGSARLKLPNFWS